MDHELKAKVSRNLLYWGLFSIVMLFSGLTSAYLVTRADNFWVNINMPRAFIISTGIIVLSSLTANMAVKATKSENEGKLKLWVTLTLLLGIGFSVSQFVGYSELVEGGHFFTGNALIDENGTPMMEGEYGKDYSFNFKGTTLVYEDNTYYFPDGSKITSSQYLALQGSNNSASSYMYILTGVHFVHVAGGLIYLLVLFGRIMSNRFDWITNNRVGLIATYWHFVDVLWIYLFLFLFFIH